MPLFGRRHDATGAGPADASGFADAATARGLEPVTGAVLDQPIADAVREAGRVLHGLLPQPVPTGTPLHNYAMNFHDAFGTTRDGRAIVVANGVVLMNSGLLGTRLVGTSLGTQSVGLCVVELPSMLALACVQPRHYRHRVVRHIPEHETGNPVFDARFIVNCEPGLPATIVTPDMQRLIMVHDDWIFRVARNQFICVGQDPFGSVDEMLHRIDEVLAVVASIPTTVLAARVDHSDDDLIVRIGRLDSVEDAISFLQQLTPDDRARLARSETPLSAFADVTTPDEAIARFQALDPAQQMQLLTMFESAEGTS